MYDKIISFENLYQAANEAARNKRYRVPIMRYFSNLEENLINAHNHLIWGSYEPQPHRQFFVYEPKKRLISAPPFDDRVVHHAIHRIIEPIIDKRFIFDSYACRIGKGTHRGADRAQRFIRIVKRNHGRVYVLKADIAKYFNSINHASLKRIIRSHLNCERTIALLNLIIDKAEVEVQGVGIPIGNLTSQLFANLYLNELDRFVKHELREKHYIRYMDDFVILHHDKAHLQRLRVTIERWLLENLQLKTNNKTQIFPVSTSSGRALDFLGYRIYATHKLLRKCTAKRFKHKVKKLRKQYAKGKASLAEVRSVIASYNGCIQHAKATALFKSALNEPFVRTSHD
ncbi:RNA-dependent DNA polymerase [Vibrio cincinnatiensis]|uniref:reverse transcriptase/maturase family protein n=1 Tax=Vibrio cincinnatiensis TaxID=675 RepID=UPI001EDEA52B|nr:reverse transcriptase/maturase family protein [Vibrio cincinnatiensis]MCG3744424.1 RNA-dependent DNA polymerase [Vibrio cincinnatiensis]